MNGDIKILRLAPGKWRVCCDGREFDLVHIDDVMTCIYGLLTDRDTHLKPKEAKPVDSDIDFGRFTDFFNNAVRGTVIPQIRKLTDKRKKAVKARLSDRDVTKTWRICPLSEFRTNAPSARFRSRTISVPSHANSS